MEPSDKAVTANSELASRVGPYLICYSKQTRNTYPTPSCIAREPPGALDQSSAHNGKLAIGYLSLITIPIMNKPKK